MTVTFKIHGLRNNRGYLRGLAFAGSGAGFPENHALAALKAETKAEKGTVEISFDDLKEQDAAFCFFHDEKDAKAIEKSFLGIPKGGIAVSNWGGLFKPSYD